MSHKGVLRSVPWCVLYSQQWCFSTNLEHSICIFLPISLLEDRFIRISYFGIIFVVSEFVAQDVIFYPCHL